MRFCTTFAVAPCLFKNCLISYNYELELRHQRSWKTTARPRCWDTGGILAQPVFRVSLIAMATLKPNTEVIRKALRGPRERYSIDGHEGLSLHARGDGNGSYLVRYRVNGNRRFHTLHADARNATLSDIIGAKNEWLSTIALTGADPRVTMAAEKSKAEGERITFGECFETWLAHTGKRRKRALSPRSIESYRGLYKLHVGPHFGKLPIAQMARVEIEAALRQIKKATTDPKKGKRGLQATKALTLMHSVCEWSVDAGFIDRNPCRGIDDPAPKDNPEGKQTRPVTDEELRIFWSEAPATVPLAAMRVIKLAFLLGRRISEISNAARHEALLDQEPPVLLIPADRIGNKAKVEDVVPLPRMAAAIIREALNTGKPTDPLFVGAHGDGTATGEFREFRRAKGWPGRTRLHDARTLVNDNMARMKVPTELRSRTLHHTGDLKALVNTVYSAYDHMDDRMRALRLWELRLRNIVSGRKMHVLRWA